MSHLPKSDNQLFKTKQSAATAAIASFVLWGFFPIYWKNLAHIRPLEILSHRMVWSTVFYLSIFCWKSRQSSTTSITDLLRELRNESRKSWLLSAAAGFLLALNWGVYIFAVNSGRVLEGSLAYFITPFLNVAMGAWFFHEPLSRPLRTAIAIAGIGVLWKMALGGEVPWLSLIMAFSFATYGLIKKFLVLRPDKSSVMEGLSTVIPAILVATAFRYYHPSSLSPKDLFLLIFSGVVTGLPLYLFSAAAQKIEMAFIGMSQFLSPVLQFLVGYWIYKEAVSAHSWISFGFIGLGVFVYFVSLINRISK